MLKQLKVKNFRRLRDATVDFTPGLNVVRGQNEAGKSTMLEAITYAFFGVSACRTSLAEMVTWGEKESSLKVELTFTVEGGTYVISRSKSGAEVNWTRKLNEISATHQLPDSEAGRVVGQKEVAAFVGRLFGVSSQNVNRLILSGQGNIRGALSEGSTKTAELIEQLANFSVIDDVIELIGEKLTTGATAPFEEKAEALGQELSTLEGALVPPDTAEDETILSNLTLTVAAVEEEAAKLLEAVGPAATRRDALRLKAAEKASLDARRALLIEQLTQAQDALHEHVALKPERPDADRAVHLQRAIADHQRNVEREKGRAAVKNIKYPEGNFWEGNFDTFNYEVQKVAFRFGALRNTVPKLEGEIAVLRAQKQAAGTCGVCGQDFTKLPAVAAHNMQLDEEIAEKEEELLGVKADIPVEEATAKSLQACQAEHNRIQAALARYGDDVMWDLAVYPHRPSWISSDVALALDPISAQAELDTLRAQDKRVDAWETTFRIRGEASERCFVAVEAVNASLATGFPGLQDLPALEAEVAKLNDDYAALYTSLAATQSEAATLSTRVSSAKATYAAAVARVEQVKKEKDEAVKLIEEITFNNALLKRVRAARPIIANKLWSMVLTAVSRYFSQMRGTDSIVSKDTEGFKVDGKVIESLSGSTLDILGLAIRLALVRTFLPHTPLLILDEPSAACDTARTEAMMGFLVSCGFDQMLLVTHEDTSEKVAENLIAI